MALKSSGEISPASGSRVLVTGATGYTGMVLVKKLLDSGCQVRVIARRSSDAGVLSSMDITWFRGEISDEHLIAEAVDGVEYIFHVAAAFREAKNTRETYWNVHVRSTMLLAQEAVKQEHFKRFVHVSTIGVHGHIESPPADESYPFDPDDDYQRTKAEAERWLVQFGSEQNLPYTIIRPCAIYGPGEKRLLKIFKMASKKLFLILGSGKCWYHLVHVEDLTSAILQAAVKSEALSEVFIIGSSEPITLERLAHKIANSYGLELRIIRLPIRPFFLLGDLCEKVCRPFGIEPPIYRRRVAFYSKDRFFSVNKMKNVLGYQPKYENDIGIPELAKWYKEQGWLDFT
ncbi:MAG: NAD-dependent epimerase/dehydratase family protein [Desulfobulbaceae bacterium]|nr:MAG: NAD-dependent epimerase/dehydratase family protein [Desulfobulbaceae bacterium]